jgi:hypothetical protein
MPLQATSGAASYDAFGGGVPVVPNYIEDVFSTYLYTGNGSTQNIVNGINLSDAFGKGGLTWIKSRSAATNNFVFDTDRGTLGEINSNTTDAQTSLANSLTSFNADGFSVGSAAGINVNAATYASWTFRRQPKFFDIVYYTGTGSNRTIAHNLGSVPGCIIIKSTDTVTNWAVYHKDLANTEYLVLNSTAAKATGATWWNSTTPTSSVFSVGTNSTVNASGSAYIAYVFAHDAGGFGLTGTDNVISCGSFTTDGGGDFSVNLGYEPQWLLCKSTTSATLRWYLMDSMRGMPDQPGSSATSVLSANTSGAELSGNNSVHPTATGFAGAGIGGSETYIYIAIRRGPMKVPTSGTSVYNGIARTGTGAVATVTGVGFAPDLVIDKYRTAASDNHWIDKLRGATRNLASTATAAEDAKVNGLTAFAMDGYVVGTDAEWNFSGEPYINWFFKRAPSVFDEVCWSGAGANLVINHNLQAVPELIINKYRNGTSYGWATTAAGLANPNTNYLTLNSSNAEANAGASPGFIYDRTSTTFTVSSDLAQSGFNWVSYLFATCPGVSKVGSYTGNGSTQTINCGFGAGGARFVLIKRTDTTGDWYVYDTARGMTTLTDPYLPLNSTAAETATLGSVTTVSTGFALNSTILAAINVSGGTYIFLAFA